MRKFLAIFLAVATMATCAFTIVACSKDKQKEEEKETVEQAYTGGMQIAEGVSNGITLKTFKEE